MAISAREFIDRVTNKGDGAVAGEEIAGPVSITNAELKQGDWSDCKFDSSVKIERCSIRGNLNLQNAQINGDFAVDGLDFSEGGLSAQALHCRGSLRLSQISESFASANVTVVHADKPNAIESYTGLQLVQIRIDGSATIEDCRGGAGGATGICMDYAQIGGYLSIGRNCTAFSGLFMNQAKVAGMLLATLEPPSENEQAWNFLLLDGLECGSDASVDFVSKAGFQRLFIRACKIRGNLRVGAFGAEEPIESGFVWLDGAEVRGDLTAKNLGGSGNMHALDVQVGNDLIVDNCSFGNLDLYGAYAGGVWLKGVTIAALAEGQNSALDLGNSRVSGPITLDNFKGPKISVRYAEAGAFRLTQAEVGQLELDGTWLKAYFAVNGSDVGRLNAQNVRGTATFLSSRRSADEGFECSEFGSIELGDSEWASVDLSNICLKGNLAGGLPQAPRISCTNTRITNDFKLRASQFEALNDLDAMLLDLSGANIGRMDIAFPLPGKMRFKGAQVASWGLKQESAEAYDRIMRSTGEFDQGAYLEFENRLENAGLRHEADKLHRIWRRREERGVLGNRPSPDAPVPSGVRLRELPSRLWRKASLASHRVLLGYGTQKWRILVIWFFLAILCWGYIHLRYAEDIRVNPAALATLQECGVPCIGAERPTLSIPGLRKLGDSAQLTASSAVSLIDLGLAKSLEPTPGSRSFWALLIMRLVGWIALPLFLSSAVAGFFPKRHRA